MVHTHLSLSNPPPAACLNGETTRPAFYWHCHLPLALERADVQADLDLEFRIELAGGPLAQGSAIRAVTVPPGGVVRVLLHEQHSRLILETDSPNLQRCEAVAAETTYLQNLRCVLRRLGWPPNDYPATANDHLHVTGTPVSFPFLTQVLLGLIDRAENSSRISEAAARTARSSLPARRASAPSPRVLSNSNRLRALTLFFYHAEKFQLARLELHQIDRVVKAPSETITAEVQAEIDQNLIGLALIDHQGCVTATARARCGWQRTFRLPTPHILVKPCPIDVGTTDMASGDVSVDLQPRPDHVA